MDDLEMLVRSASSEPTGPLDWDAVQRRGAAVEREATRSRRERAPDGRCSRRIARVRRPLERRARRRRFVALARLVGGPSYPDPVQPKDWRRASTASRDRQRRPAPRLAPRNDGPRTIS